MTNGWFWKTLSLMRNLLQAWGHPGRRLITKSKRKAQM